MYPQPPYPTLFPYTTLFRSPLRTAGAFAGDGGVTPLRLEAPAKLNLSLAVVGRRADGFHELVSDMVLLELADRDRKSTRLNSSHLVISYSIFCLKNKKLYY